CPCCGGAFHKIAAPQENLSRTSWITLHCRGVSSRQSITQPPPPSPPQPGPIVEAACRAHSRRQVVDLARLQKTPIAIEAVKRIDALFAIEREINGLTAQERRAVRHERSRPLITELEGWLREQRRTLSSKSDKQSATLASTHPLPR